MPTIDSENLTLEAAQALLKQFTCVDRASAPTTLDPVLVRQSLLLVAAHSDYQILGICADTLEQAATALKTYLTALGYEITPEIPPLEGVVYVKFNPKRDRCHVAPYDGVHRGMLVSCQSAYDGDVNETFGHLPLDLFM
ncbi:DUF1824 family protein [Stenomitos frigidus]|uniref:DUF1824 domain-containing protein n=1 Tax=Stenomitos frigidus ULC18 TaxID=2107698 RepID=A0A2T1ER57_9CYAN|nr:DUF1824 family protein [Stenomitos frigidus]PSB35230.1 DUF1824 domain-containing protein [Stenomitos frigidus ULC18]